MNGVAFCLIATTVLSVAAAAEAGVDANGELENAYRSDLVGPEVWTITQGPRGLWCGNESGARLELPSEAWSCPRPGLSGQLYIVHNALCRDAVSLTIEDGGTALKFVPVRNRWTPAWMNTFYRSEALARAGDDPEAGATVLHERKCITGENAFIAEAVIKNTSATSRVYRVSVRADAALPRTPGPFAFTTLARCRRRPRRTFAALGTSDGLLERTFTLPPNGTRRFRYGFAVDARSAEAAKAAFDGALAAADPFAENAMRFNAWMAAHAPALRIDDRDLMRLWVYRWYLVWRGTHEARRVIADHAYPRPAVYESPMGDWFDAVVGLSVPLQLQELAWMRDPAMGRNLLLNWTENVVGYREHIQYIAMAAWRFHQNHPDVTFARRVCPELVRASRARQGNDPAKLPVLRGSWELAMEYQPNFCQFTDPKWDYRHEGEFEKKYGTPRMPLVRLDAASYLIGDLMGCARLAAAIGDRETASDCAARADAALKTLESNHWHEGLGLFLAADPSSGRLADEAACFDSFAPYMWGMVRDRARYRAFDKFCDPQWFWDDFPITTVAKTCPMYCGADLLRGPFRETPGRNHRYMCSWNGPIWHYADTIAAEAFGNVAKAEPSRRGKWLEFFRRCTESHFAYGDRTVPRAAEHFRPEDGFWVGGAYDYFHSAWIDPFLRWWCGVSVSDDMRTIVFEPFSDVDFRLDGVPVAGREFSFERRGDRLTAFDARGNMVCSGTGRVTFAADSSHASPGRLR